MGLPLVILAVSILAGCSTTASPAPPSATPGEPSPSPSPEPTQPAAELLLRVVSEGGFIGPAANLAALPLVSVYADGRILVAGAVDAIYPGPLVLPVVVRDVGAAGAQAIVAAIRAAGLDRPSESDPGIAADTGVSVFSVNLDGTTVTTRYANSGPPGPGSLGGGDNPARDAAFALLERLGDPAETWGAGSVTETPYAGA